MIVLSDEEIFTRIYEKYFSRLVVFALPFLGTVASAEDIVQDVFLKLHRLDNEFDSEARLKSFLYKTVRNRAIDELRTKRRTEEFDQKIEETYSDEMSLNDELDGDLIYLLVQSLRDLPPQSKKVIELLYENDLSYREVAAALDISPHTVKNMRKFALTLLRKKLDNKKLLSILLMTIQISPGI